MGYLLRRAANREWNQPKRKKCAAVNKAEWSWGPEEHLYVRHEDTELGIYLAGFGLVFIQYFLSILPSLSLIRVNVYVLEACDLLFDFNFTGDYS